MPAIAVQGLRRREDQAAADTFHKRTDGHIAERLCKAPPYRGSGS